MCGQRSKLRWLGLAALLLLSWPAYSAESYTVTAEELTELETIIEQQSKTISEQRQTLTQLQQIIQRQDSTLTRLQKITLTQASTIDGLGTSLDAYESEGRRAIVDAYLTAGGVGFAAGAVAVVVVFVLAK